MSSILVPGLRRDPSPVVRHDGTGPLCSCGSNGTAPVLCKVHHVVTPMEAFAMWRREKERAK